MERRAFFKIITAASAGAATGACGKKIDRYIPLLVSDREVAPGEEQWHPGVCGECGAGCGVIARVMEGERVVEREGEQLREKIACVKKLEGNPLDPVSGGRLCARGQASLQGLYNPDRLRGPMRRVGPRGQAEFAPTSWEEAVAVAAEKLTLVREADPTRIVFLTGPQAGTRALAIRRFLEALGAPPAVNFGIADFPLERKAAEQVYGWNGLPVYDLARARFAVGIGADFLGGWASPVYYSRQFGHLRQGRPGVRGSLVQAESRLSITAAAADEWVALRPGTELFFAAALGRLLISENLARQAPPAVARAFEAVDLAAALAACGVAEKRLRRLAGELGESEAPLVLAGASSVHTNSLAALVAAGYLNLLLGNVGRPGGVHPPAVDPTNSRALFGNAVAAFERAQFVFLDGANPAYTLPSATGVAGKLQQFGVREMLLSFSPFLDDSGAFADLLLPDHHALETAAAIAPPVAPGPAWALATPFVRPLYDTRATERVLGDLAKTLGLVYELPTARSVVEKLLPEGSSWEEATRQGGWWGEPASAAAAGAAPTALDLSSALFSGEETQFPLHFQPYLSLQFLDGRSANLPWMQELPDPASSAMWGLPVEVDAQTAARLGIETGDRVRLTSPHGELEASAYIHPAAAPGVVSMAIGQGHRHFGRFASNRGANPLSILSPVWEQSTGALALGATRVRLLRVGSKGGLIQFSPRDREQGPWGRGTAG